MPHGFLKRCIIIFLLLLCINKLAQSQDNAVKDSIKGKHCLSSKIKLNLGADIVSRYIWRGSDYGKSPSVQPSLSISIANFEAGCWGAIAVTSFYKEVDLYVKYTLKNFSLTFTDYYIPSVNGTPASPDNRYFIYDDKKTAHTFEGSLLYKAGGKFPLWIMGGVFFYGNDKRWGCHQGKDTTNGTYYSSYFEAGYTFNIKENSVDLYLGFTPAAGAFGNKAGIVNCGLTGCRKIRVSGDFELPVKASLIFNPQSSDVYFVFGITI